MVIGWENVDNLEDYFITYLLYKESLTVPQISKIRNISEKNVNEDLIKAKLAIREINKSKKNGEKDTIEYYLSLSKEERLNFIQKLYEPELNSFKRMIYKGILRIQNIDDLMVLVWTVGELRDENFLNIIYPLTEKSHSNMRRIAYSAIGKIGSESSINVMEMGLLDNNPQVRQYCAKYLGIIGSRDSIRILENLVKNKSDFEKEYVLRACIDSIESLKSKFNISK